MRIDDIVGVGFVQLIDEIDSKRVAQLCPYKRRRIAVLALVRGVTEEGDAVWTDIIAKRIEHHQSRPHDRHWCRQRTACARNWIWPNVGGRHQRRLKLLNQLGHWSAPRSSTVAANGSMQGSVRSSVIAVTQLFSCGRA
jgi:hypothetical protein